jgi:two-component system, NarL family, sensor histidine kinase UhpB
MHDEIGPLLFAVEVDAAAVRQFIESGTMTRPARVPVFIQDSGYHMQRHVKCILVCLKPAAMQGLGLAHAVRNHAAFWQSRQPHLLFRVEVCQDSFGEALDATVYRIIQESLSNAVRHGSPAAIEIVVDKADENVLAVQVQDGGGGLPAAPSRTGFGIPGMKERVTALEDGGEAVTASPVIRII